MRKLNKIITTAAMVAAILAGTAPKAAATGCPYTVGPLGRYIAPAIVQGMTATDDGAVEVWCTDALDGDDWYFLGPDGAMSAGWVKWEDKFYYMNPENGKMLRN